MFLNPQDIVVITGAASGMGRAYATAFAHQNCQLALCDVDEQGLNETCAQVTALTGETCLQAVVNVADGDEVGAFAQRVNRELGPARVVINNAGIEGSAQPSWQSPLAIYEQVMAVNYFGVVHGCRSFLPQLLTYPDAWLVNISSVFGLIGTPNHTDYCGSKFAVRGYTEALRAELNGSGVQVMLVHPGGVNTRIARQEVSRSFAEHFLKSTPEQVVEQVLRAMAKGRARVVCGHNSWKTAVASRLLPLGWLSRLVWRELSRFIDTRHYPARQSLSGEIESAAIRSNNEKRT